MATTRTRRVTVEEFGRLPETAEREELVRGEEDTVRGPHAAFISSERLPPGGIGPGYLEMAPDLVVETLSPSDTAWEIDEKVDDYLTSGTRIVWLIDPRTRRVTILSTDAPVRWVRDGETLDAEPVIPGFTCLAEELFEGLAP